MSKFDLRQKLENQFVQLKKKEQLIEYYMDFQFPQKQTKIAEWWEKVLAAYLSENKKLTISLNQVQEFFTIHGMKPLPLKKLLTYFIKKNIFTWVQKRQQPEKSGMWSSMTRWFKKQAQDTQNNVATYPIDKIYYTIAKKQKVKEASFVLPVLFLEQAVANYSFILQKLGSHLGLVQDTQLVLAQFYEMGIMMKDKIEECDVLIYSKQKNLQNYNWVITNKTKYLINSKLEFFEKIIAKRCQQYDNQANQAKECIRNNDKKTAQRLVKSCKNIQGTVKNYQNRMGALRNTLNQVQINEIDGVTVDMLMKTQDIIKKTMVDVDKLETIKQVNEDISASQNQVHMQLQGMSKHFDNQQEADQLYKQLTQQMNQQKLHLIKSGVKNISLSIPQQQYSKPEKMQIENDRQQMFN